MKPGKSSPQKSLNSRTEKLMKELLAKIAEASYQVAKRLGFRGSFISFLSDLEDALQEVIDKDRSDRPTSH